MYKWKEKSRGREGIGGEDESGRGKAEIGREGDIYDGGRVDGEERKNGK